jgi:hypothetical protein
MTVSIRHSFEDYMNEQAATVWYTVAVVEHETERTVKTFKPVKSEREAEKIERGVLRNLNTEKFYVEIRNSDQQ